MVGKNVRHKKIIEAFKRLGFKIVDDKILTFRFAPKENDIKKIKEFGRKLAKINV